MALTWENLPPVFPCREDEGHAFSVGTRVPLFFATPGPGFHKNNTRHEGSLVSFTGIRR